MKHLGKFGYWIATIVLLTKLSGCSVAKYVPEGEVLLIENKLKVSKDTLTDVRMHSGLSTELEEILRPLPNKTLLFTNYPFKVWFYYVIGEPKREKGLRNWLRKQLGEQPVYITARSLDLNRQSLEGYLHNQGYFRSEAEAGVEPVGKKKAKAVYGVYVRPRYTINQLTFKPTGVVAFDSAYQESMSATLLKEGSPYQLNAMEAERIRIDQHVKTKGFYYFSPEHLIVKIDSALGNYRFDATVELKPDVPRTALKPYYVRDVKIYTEYKGPASDTLSEFHRLRTGGELYDPRGLFRPRVFEEIIGFKPGSRYNSEVQNITLSRIINLKNFKYVRNKFEMVPRSDSALIDVYYQLSPSKRKSLRAEVSGLTKSNNLGGIQAVVSWNHKNLFRGAEQLRISADAGLDWQLGGGTAVSGTNFLRYKFEGELSFPRFVVPYWRHNPEIDETLPRTSLLLSYENLVQAGLYTLNSMRGQWGYTWQYRETTHTLAPFGVNVVRPRNISEAFTELIFDSPNMYDIDRYFRILENRLLLESSYTISYNPKQNSYSRNQVMLSGGLNMAGNLAGLLVKKTESGTRELFDIPFEQFVRADAEVRYYRTISPSLKWANRVILGFGLPYGNSIALPQFKQYFVGGSTGIRAFQARTIGPGAYHADSVTRAIFRNTQFGDIKMEFNTELRVKMSSLFHGAVFVDAGNVWNYRVLAEYGENSVLDKNFYKQLAIGGGLGLRMDFTYLVLRLDLATPFRKPWYAYEEEPRNPWVFREINFSNKTWRRENLVLNIAVAYPF